MKTLLAILTLTACAPDARADSTIDPAAAFAWAGNVGWTNWRPSAADGAVIGEYVCSGSVFCANIGWVNMGSGTPADGIRYGNAIAGDYGVNYFATTTPGIAALRGFAFGANIGWINFETLGNARLDLTTGEITGYAWSANCGWINLGSGTAHGVSTTSVAPGADADTDGITDAWERENAPDLFTLTLDGDADGDGTLDLEEYAADTDPLDGADRLRITDFAASADTTLVTLTWTSRLTRLYRIEWKADLGDAVWEDSALGAIAPDGDLLTGRSVTELPSARRFYRVRAGLPLAP